MKPPVCVSCEREMRAECIGVLVIETAGEDRHPYKVWQADMYKCPGCGVEVVVGFARGPVLERFHVGFAERLEDWKKVSGRVVYNHEKRGG